MNPVFIRTLVRARLWVSDITDGDGTDTVDQPDKPDTGNVGISIDSPICYVLFYSN